MNKTLILLVLLLCGHSALSAQTKTEALRDAKIAATSTLNGDFETLIKYTHPKVIEFMGGEKNALDIIKSSFESMAREGLVFEKADVISVSEVVLEQGEHRCYIEGYNQMKMPGIRIKSKSYLLGFYDAEKKAWSFIEASKVKDSNLMDKIFPKFKTALEIPEDTMETENI